MAGKFYYDLNVQVWEDADRKFTYSVIQEFDLAGKDKETLAVGQADTIAEALEEVSTVIRYLDL